MANFSLYKKALEADKRFTRELERVYGKHASQARYWSSHKDAKVAAAMRAKVKADRRWLDEMRRTAKK